VISARYYNNYDDDERNDVRAMLDSGGDGYTGDRIMTINYSLCHVEFLL